MLYIKLKDESQLNEVAQFIDENTKNGNFKFDEEGYLIGDYEMDLTDEDTKEEDVLKYCMEIRNSTMKVEIIKVKKADWQEFTNGTNKCRMLDMLKVSDDLEDEYIILDNTQLGGFGGQHAVDLVNSIQDAEKDYYVGFDKEKLLYLYSNDDDVFNSWITAVYYTTHDDEILLILCE